MTELQAALLLAQMTRLEEQMRARERSAALLDELLGEIVGIMPPARDDRVTRHAHHLYMFRIDPARTGRIGKADFILKLQVEGIPVNAGYFSLNRNEAIIEGVRELTGAERIDSCPVSERVSEKEVVWLGQHVLLSGEKAKLLSSQFQPKIVVGFTIFWS
ncbi:DegT/DnrJ/EryC1/StrS family aminotransferase [Paenibacillus sp. MBLB4367]|uniref:DegT/DnrJ/EryC1/StrS family aminotransferase n=1 Tax=Paenibacillus sp. MBLB4367 TaxID=3384767 RepID=UPI003908280A